MKFSQFLVPVGFLLDSLLVPLLQYSVHSLLEIHKVLQIRVSLFSLFQRCQEVIDLSSLSLGEE